MDSSSQYVQVRVVDQFSNEFHVRMKRTTSLSVLMKYYERRIGVPQNLFQLVFNGHKISEVDTFESLEINDGDRIEARPETGLNRYYERAVLWAQKEKHGSDSTVVDDIDLLLEAMAIDEQ